MDRVEFTVAETRWQGRIMWRLTPAGSSERGLIWDRQEHAVGHCRIEARGRPYRVVIAPMDGPRRVRLFRGGESFESGLRMPGGVKGARQSEDKTLERTAMRIRARALRRCRELLSEVERSQGGRPKKTKDGDDPSFSRKQAASDAGLSERQAKDAIRVASVPQESFDKQVESDKPPTITALAGSGRRGGWAERGRTTP